MRFLSSLIFVGCIALVCSGSLATESVAQEEGDFMATPATPVNLNVQTELPGENTSFDQALLKRFMSSTFFIEKMNKFSTYVINYIKGKNVSKDPKDFENMSDEEKVVSLINDLQTLHDNLEEAVRSPEAQEIFSTITKEFVDSVKQPEDIVDEELMQEIKQAMEESVKESLLPAVIDTIAEQQDELLEEFW